MVKATQIANGGFGHIDIVERNLSLDRGRTYFVPDGMSATVGLMDDLMLENHEVLVITRYHPSILMDMMSHYARAYWLSERNGEMNIKPTRPRGIIEVMESFLERAHDPVICLDGIEYMSLFMEKKKLLMMVEEINDIIMDSGAIMLVPLNPRSFDSRTLASIWRYAEILG